MPLRQRAPSRQAEPMFGKARCAGDPIAQIGDPREAAQSWRITGQVCDQPLLEIHAVASIAGGKMLDLQLGHIDAGRALAPAPLARYAKIERVAHRVAGKILLPELARKRKTQRVGPSSRRVLLVARDAKARAHRSGVELAAMSVVVAHLDRVDETMRRVCPRAWLTSMACQRVAPDIPRRPIQRGFESRALIPRTEAKQRRIVHPRRRDDLAGIHAVARIEQRLDLSECGVEPRPELPRHPFAATKAVSMLAGVSALVLANHDGSLLRDGAHFRRAAAPHVENRAHVQGAHTGVRVPGAVGTVLPKNLRQTLGVFLEVLERDGAVFDERNRLAVAFHRR